MFVSPESVFQLIFTPARRPDSRWRIACALQFCASAEEILGEEFGPDELDADTRTLTAFLRADQAGHNPEPPEGLEEAQAFANSDPLTRVPVEGYILADRSPEFIAERTGLSAAGLRWFESAFFDARVRLRARDWIFGNLLYCEEGDGVSPHAVCCFLRGVAFNQGVDTFEQCLAAAYAGSAYARFGKWTGRQSPPSGKHRADLLRAMLVTLVLKPSDMLDDRYRVADQTAEAVKRLKRKLTEEEDWQIKSESIDRILAGRYGVQLDEFTFFPDEVPLVRPTRRLMIESLAEDLQAGFGATKVVMSAAA